MRTHSVASARVTPALSPKGHHAQVFCRWLGACLFGLAPLFTFLALPLRDAQAQTPAKIISAQQSSAKSPQEAEPAAPTPAASTDQSIPLPQIADRAEDLDRQLREIRSQLTPKSELLDVNRKAEAHAAEIRERARQAGDLLAGTPTPMELEDEQRYWRSLSLDNAAQRELLKALAAKKEDQIRLLEDQQGDWYATWIQIHKSSGISAVVDRVREALEAIRATRSQVQEQLYLLLTVQNQVSQQGQQISDVLTQVRLVRDRERGRLFEPDSGPLWEVRGQSQLEQTARPGLHRSFDRSFITAEEFFKTHKFGVIGFVAFYLLALFGVFKLRRYVEARSLPEIPSGAMKVLEMPFSVALLVALLGTGESMAVGPIGIAVIFYLLYLIPVLRLLAPMVEHKLRTLLNVLAVFYVLEGLYQLIQLPSVVRRELYALIVLAALVSFGWLTRPSRMGLESMRKRSRLILLLCMRACLVLLAVSFVANIFGYFSLAQVLGLTAIVGPFAAASLYCGARVLTLILSTVLRTQWAQNLSQMGAAAIERWGGRLLAFGALLFWLRAMFHLLTIYDAIAGAVLELLQYPIGVEKVHFTLVGALTLVFILLGGYTLANALTFFLKKLVLPKLPLQRGVPYAISTVTYYVLLLLVALAALSSAGVELNKFTVLTGALGVGLGFGLQNIVNNFVSGLILLFERPIHVGDTVEVGGLVGTIRRIGARSSTVLTYQGAEVIVPNSNLLSNQVINWTLSSPWRRVDVPVNIAYGTDPERVIKLLVGVAESHPGVLLARPPAAFFLGFGESALRFELRFWSTEQDTWFQLQSDVTVAVAKALREAGIEVPFPQQDLHVRSIDASVAESLSSKGVRMASSAEAAQRSAR